MPTPPVLLDLTENESLDPISHAGDVRFRGTIRAGRVVEIGGCLTVDGDLEASRYFVAGTLTVIGTARGGKACTVGGEMRCRAIVDTTVVVRGDVKVRDRIASSRVTCAGRVNMPDGEIVASDVSANGGVECRAIGDDHGTPTDIEAGVGRPLTLLEAAITRQVDERRQREDVLRASIEPLMANMKALTPAQREKATEMLYQADAMSDETTKLIAAFERRRRRTIEQARPRIAVTTRVHPGVVVRFDGTAFATSSVICGPIALTCRKSEGATEIVAIPTDGGAVEILTARAAA